MTVTFSKLKILVLVVALMASLSVSASARQDLSFLTPDGQTVSASSMRGRVVVLLFGGVQDPQCREEIRALQALVERYEGKPVSVFWVSINSPSEMSNEKLKAPCGQPGAVAVLRDQGQSAFRRFGCRQLPTVVVLNQQGELHGQPRGGFNPNSDFVNDIAAIIDSLLNRK